ncbi:hypothetical protein [Engelhardtia mirabilis]|uniref:Uncharacterized protein n=1 Tax=Engelhardtia mirabilis TaxID=2528011 RepID=A0A518BR54_9BACT|nr:hypothetical protein Pla133_45750 [Planctomycetes bacterium Pla133]QDV03781.1 hypothetical protein Pla86_45730 [Planctomycetes bacterium Pla86]
MNATLHALAAMSDDRFLAIYESLLNEGFGPLDGEVAKALKFRPHAIKKLPLAQRSKHAKRLIERANNVELAYELLGGYLMDKSPDLVTDFLDATGVEHDQGMIENTGEQVPDAAKIPAAVEQLDGKYDPQDVSLYLALSTITWPQVEAFQTLWESRAGAAS